MEEKKEEDLFASILRLPLFQEAGLDEVELTPEEKEEIEKDAKQMLLNYLLSLPAFKSGQK